MSLKLPQFTVSGTPEAMGQTYGKLCGERIHAFVADRMEAVEDYLNEAGHSGTTLLLDAGATCLERVRSFDPDGYEEHFAIAKGAEIDPVRLFSMANMTDIRDIVVLPSDPPVLEDEGCTAALVPPNLSANGHSLQGQTWDLNSPDLKHVIALHRIPDDGPEIWTVTCAGCQTLMGMNEYGVTVGTTNLKTMGSRIGIPYLSVLHLALKQRSRDAASQIVKDASVAGGHTYWIGDPFGATEWEKSPDQAFSRTTDEGPLSRSNHCLFEANISLESDLSESTHSRLARMQSLLRASNAHTVESLRQLFSDRSDGRLSINRFAEDDSGATTNAVVAFNPVDLEFLACRGQADRSEWVQLNFERSPSHSSVATA